MDNESARLFFSLVQVAQEKIEQSLDCRPGRQMDDLDVLRQIEQEVDSIVGELSPQEEYSDEGYRLLELAIEARLVARFNERAQRMVFRGSVLGYQIWKPIESGDPPSAKFIRSLMSNAIRKIAKDGRLHELTEEHGPFFKAWVRKVANRVWKGMMFGSGVPTPERVAEFLLRDDARNVRNFASLR